MNSRPKVLQILYSGLGGHGAVVFSLLAADKQKAWQHSLIFYGVEELRPEYEAFCSQNEIPYAFVKKASGLDVPSLNKIFHFIKQQSPDVILLHSSTLAPYLIFDGRRLCSKLILVEHNANAHKTKFEWLSSLCGMLFFKRVVYLSSEYLAEVQQRLKFFFRNKKAAVIPNGIDTAFFSPVAPVQEKKNIITMIGRFSPIKDYPTLINAFSMLASQRQDVQLVLAGDGETRKANEALVKTLGLEDRVLFTGTISEAQLRDLLRTTKVYVHSSMRETMSTAIMQAMSCGLPVIASDIPGINNLINEETGILFIPEDVTALYRQMNLLLNDEPAMALLGRRARSYSLKHFSHYVMFEKYNKLISKRN